MTDERWRKCARCKGEGWNEPNVLDDCPDCEGLGYVRTTEADDATPKREQGTQLTFL